MEGLRCPDCVTRWSSFAKAGSCCSTHGRDDLAKAPKNATGIPALYNVAFLNVAFLHSVILAE
jgi:hypothetical protein